MSKYPLSACVLGLLPSLSLSAQVPRATIAVNTNPSDDARGISIASDDDLSVIAWNEGGSTNQVFVSTSDGAGLSWTAPLRVDNDAFVKTSQTDSVFVAGDKVYVIWEANSGLSIARSTDRGLSFGTPQQLDIGPGSVRDWRVAFSPDGTGDHLYVLSSTAVLDEDLYLTSSHDDGVSFSAAVLVPSVGATGDVDSLAVAAALFDVFIAWDDNRSGRDSVYFQHSSDGGATFLASDISLGANVGVEDSQDTVQIAESGSIVAVMWNEEPSGSGNEVIRANVSTDSGATFQGAVTVGNYSATVDDTDAGDVGIDPSSGRVLVTWEDNRSGSDEAYVTTSSDGGLTFAADLLLSACGAQNPALVIVPGPKPAAIVQWESTDFNPTNRAESSLSLDGGLSFGAAIQVSDNTGFVDFPTAAYGNANENLIHAYATLEGSVLRLRAGGYSICGPAATVSRNAGSNPQSYSASPAILGATFTGTVDLSTSGHSLAGIVGFASPLTFPLGGGQVLLVNALDPSGEVLNQPIAVGPTAVFSFLIPNDPALCDLTVYSQAIHIGTATPFALSNAEDFTLGAF